MIFYVEPKNKEILGKFLSAAEAAEEHPQVSQRKKTKNKFTIVKSKDIRAMLNNRLRQETVADNLIVLD